MGFDPCFTDGITLQLYVTLDNHPSPPQRSKHVYPVKFKRRRSRGPQSNLSVYNRVVHPDRPLEKRTRCTIYSSYFMWVKKVKDVCNKWLTDNNI